MKISAPCIITARLMAGVKVGDAFISIGYAGGGCERDGRVRYRWFIDIGDNEYSGDDIRSGCQGGTLQSGLESLLAFLGASAESYAYDIRRGGDGFSGENSDLFPRLVVEWAYQNSDELSMLACELEETANIIDEA